MAVYPERRGGKLTGKWIAEFTKNGVRVARKRFDTKKDGEDWEGYMKLTGNPPPAPEAIATGPTFGDVADELVAARRAEGRQDASSDSRLAYLKDRFGTRPIKQLTTNDLDALVRDLLKLPGRRQGIERPGMSTATVNRYLSEMSAVFHFATNRKYRLDTPVIPWMKETGNRLHWLTEEQEALVTDKLIELGKPDYALVVRVLTATGMRWGELAGLDADQIEPNWIRLWKTKNGTARSVAITPELSGALRAVIASNGLPKYYTFRKYYRKALKSAGLSMDVSIHCLRHTTATRLIQRGVNLRIVQRYLGHKTIQTTTKYAHVTDDDLQIALEKLSPHAGQATKIAPQPVEITQDNQSSLGEKSRSWELTGEE